MSDQTPGQTLRTVELQGRRHDLCLLRGADREEAQPDARGVGHGQLCNESAHVALPEGTAVADAIATVETTGYTARLPEAAHSPTDTTDSGPGPGADAAHDAEVRSLRRRLAVSAVLTAPVLAMAMVAALQFPNCSGSR